MRLLVTLAVIQTALAATYFEWTAHDGVQVSTVIKIDKFTKFVNNHAQN